MADIVNKYELLDGAFDGARLIRETAQRLRIRSSAIPFNELERDIDNMARGWRQIQAGAALGNATQVNAMVGTFFGGTELPVNTYTSFVAVGTALDAFNAAYDGLFDTLEHRTYDPAVGHDYPLVELAQLASLVDELDAVIAAAAVVSPD